jgi:hypothetical protein
MTHTNQKANRTRQKAKVGFGSKAILLRFLKAFLTIKGKTKRKNQCRPFALFDLLFAF